MQDSKIKRHFNKQQASVYCNTAQQVSRDFLNWYNVLVRGISITVFTKQLQWRRNAGTLLLSGHELLRKVLA